VKVVDDDWFTEALELVIVGSSIVLIFALFGALDSVRRLLMIGRPLVHRRSRRVLGTGQVPQLTPVSITAVGSGSTAQLTFSKSVTIAGPLPLTVGTRTFVSQVVNSPTVVTVTMNGAVTGLAYALAANTPNVKGFDGSVNAALAGTFS
jgi:hypothetical protein